MRPKILVTTPQCTSQLPTTRLIGPQMSLTLPRNPVLIEYFQDKLLTTSRAPLHYKTTLIITKFFLTVTWNRSSFHFYQLAALGSLSGAPKTVSFLCDMGQPLKYLMTTSVILASSIFLFLKRKKETNIYWSPTISRDWASHLTAYFIVAKSLGGRCCFIICKETESRNHLNLKSWT